jgi:hypothetical protein
LGCTIQKWGFSHPGYKKLCKKVIDYGISRNYEPEQLNALKAKLDIALLRGDFLLPEKTCREKLSALPSERNYWAAVLHVALARLGKIC